MPQKCAVAGCINRSDSKDSWVVMPHVTGELFFHSCQVPEQLPIWTKLINHGQRKPRDLQPNASVCSNHFPLGYPSPRSPFPTLYLKGYDEDDEYVTARILRDTMNTDHDYLKLSYCAEGEKLRDILTVSCEEEVEDKARKPMLDDASPPGWACSVADSAHGEGQLTGCRPSTTTSLADPQSSSSAHGLVIGVKGEREEPRASRLSQQKRAPVPAADTIPSHLTENSAAGGQRIRSRKRTNSRDTDHIYNTRKSKCAKHTAPKKVTRRDTDHLYDSRRVRTVENSCPPTVNNRDTDHIYNMPRTKLNELNASAASGLTADVNSQEKDGQEMSVTGDKRVVDKDHMYQHSVRKNRNKSEVRSMETKTSQSHLCAQGKKLLKREGRDMDHRNEDGHMKKAFTSSEDNHLPNKAVVTETATSAAHSYLMRRSRKARKGSVARKQKKSPAVSREHQWTDDGASQVERSAVACSTVAASPAHSDESDRICEDDSRRTGVWHTDHRYVHSHPDPPALTTPQGYKQEHSYANSEEVRYDACVNCSQLVQQLIGTIRQQGDHIDELKKKLAAANARNKQLSSLLSHKSEGAE
ncbi:uncharacterized protein LOC143282397 [Babylonia areolata]|uniref:uncharacterized protein LOC143282397 n=1 Tax=Babylonia areolata TaxID=304850 RepID=UPI003FD084BA